MKVLGHDYVTSDDELVLYPDFFENLKIEIFATRGPEELTALVTTAGDEVEFTASMKSLQPLRHANNIPQTSIIPTLRSQNQLREGWGTLIIEGLALDRERVGHPPDQARRLRGLLNFEQVLIT